MKTAFASAALVASLLVSTGVYAKAAEAPAPANAPAGSTGLCKDGSFNTTPTKSGACKGHKGIQTWFTTSGSASATTPATSSSAPAAGTTSATATPAPKHKLLSLFSKKPATAPAATGAAAATTATAAGSSVPAAAKSAAPGGGAGKVWVNTSSNVYHCPDSKYYGKTKEGQYETEAAAIASGAHANHGKKCS